MIKLFSLILSPSLLKKRVGQTAQVFKTTVNLCHPKMTKLTVFELTRKSLLFASNKLEAYISTLGKYPHELSEFVVKDRDCRSG